MNAILVGSVTKCYKFYLPDVTSTPLCNEICNFLHQDDTIAETDDIPLEKKGDLPIFAVF